MTTPPPQSPKIYHILPVDRLSSVLAQGRLYSDAEVRKRGLGGTTVGMQKLKDDLHELEVDLPKSYVSKSDLDKRMQHIEDMFQRIYDKLDGKADKS